MVERRNVETPYANCDIAVVTERLETGWGVAVRVKHRVGDAERIIPVELPDRRFGTEEEARAHGIEAGRQWIDANAPSR